MNEYHDRVGAFACGYLEFTDDVEALGGEGDLFYCTRF
jgi:hypothetical protein